jgi:hypothetical protein
MISPRTSSPSLLPTVATTATAGTSGLCPCPSTLRLRPGHKLGRVHHPLHPQTLELEPARKLGLLDRPPLVLLATPRVRLLARHHLGERPRRLDLADRGQFRALLRLDRRERR